MLALLCLTVVSAWATAGDDIVVTPTANANEWTFTMPESDVETTGIQTLDNSTISPADNSIYDLSGRKWSNSKLSNGQMPKGVYIENGRKVVVR